MKKYLSFEGTYYKRSSREGYDSSVPSERDILVLNPERKQLICADRKWKDLFAGTFNVRLKEGIQSKIMEYVPQITEGVVKYPSKFTSIAEKRGGYFYWKCKIYSNKHKLKLKALCRMAKNPIKDVIELLSYTSISATLDISDGDKVKIKVYGERVKPQTSVNYGVATPHTFFTKANGELLPLQNIMNGGHAFLIASGKSFNEIDKNPLRFCYTMGLNNSPKAMMPFFRPNAWTCADGADKFLYTIWADPQILKIVPSSHVNKHLWNSDLATPFGGETKLWVSDMPNVAFFKRNSNFNAESFLDENTINWGCGEHTCSCGYVVPEKDSKGEKLHAPERCPKCGEKEFGGRSVFFTALKILYIMGFRHVYLLGVDFEMKEGEVNYSFNQDRKASAVKGNNSSYAKMIFRFKKLRKVFDNHGFHVYNCNRKSRLDAFDFIDYDEALKRALWYVHDCKAYTEGRLESTANLYETKWYICPKCSHHHRVSKADVKERKMRCPVCNRRIRERDRKKYVMDKSQRGIAS